MVDFLSLEVEILLMNLSISVEDPVTWLQIVLVI